MINRQEIFSRLSQHRYSGLYAELAAKRGVTRQAVRAAAMYEVCNERKAPTTLTALERMMAKRDREIEAAAAAKQARAGMLRRKAS